MTFSTLRASVLERLGEESGVSGYYEASDANDALNRAQRLFVLMTLCLEGSGTITTAAATAWYTVRTQITDWMLPLTVEYDGAKVRPARLSELDALSTTWQATAGDVERYALLGVDLLGIYKQPAAPDTLSVTYAKVPVRMDTDSDVPEIPTERHELLVDAAIALLRMREGGQEFEKVRPLFERFLSGAKETARYVRQRSLDLKYDNLPAELDRFDMSHLTAIKGQE